MNPLLRRAGQRLLTPAGYQALVHRKNVLLSKVRPLPPGSRFEEDALLQNYLQAAPPPNRFFVDIGAETGGFGSNTYALMAAGWDGVAFEPDPAQFESLARAWSGNASVSLVRGKVNPDNVVPLLDALSVPREFAFLSLDIDGYDWYVLRRLLGHYRPHVICTEINESIPPPVRFTVEYAPDFMWAVTDRFFGQSLALLHDLATEAGYALVSLHYNNAFLMPRDLSPFPALTAEEAYATGYYDRPDRDEKLPGSAAFVYRRELSDDALLADVVSGFAARQGQFTAYLPDGKG